MPSQYEVHGQTVYPWTSTEALGNLRLNSNVPKPTEIPAGHSLVRIRAAALNARDMMVLAHDPVYPGLHAPDLVPCADGAGEISAVSSEGSKWEVGQRVVISVTSWQKWTYGSKQENAGVAGTSAKGSSSTQGTLREYAVLPDNELIPAPSHLSYEELAALPACAGTAWHALFDGPKPLQPGQIVLAQGTGGVSCFVIQLASAFGATVIATSSSDAKLAQAKKMGAKFTVNYRTHENWGEEVLRLTDGKGADVVVEVAGASTIEQSIKAAAPGGVVALVGFLSGSKKTDIIGDVIFKGLTLYGVYMFTVDMTEKACRLIEDKGIKPAVGKVFEWEDAASAFVELSKGSLVGKIIIKVGGAE